jgi:hypothetical protein
MRHREFIALFAIAVFEAASHPLSAQSPRRARIGFLNGGHRTPDGRSLSGLFEMRFSRRPSASLAGARATR